MKPACGAVNRFLHSLPFLGSSTRGSCLGEVIAGVSKTIAGVCLGGEKIGGEESEGKTHHLLLEDLIMLVSQIG